MTGRRDGRKVLKVLAFSILLLSGCVTAQAPDALNLVDSGRDFSRVWRAYPDMDMRFARAGNPVPLARVRAIAIGQTKTDLVRAIGAPALVHEDGSAEFHLALPQTGRDRLVCQYRVYFDAENRVRASIWRRPQCADLVAGRKT